MLTDQQKQAIIEASLEHESNLWNLGSIANLVNIATRQDDGSHTSKLGLSCYNWMLTYKLQAFYAEQGV